MLTFYLCSMTGIKKNPTTQKQLATCILSNYYKKNCWRFTWLKFIVFQTLQIFAFTSLENAYRNLVTILTLPSPNLLTILRSMQTF